MFKKLSPNSVESDLGYAIRRIGKDEIQYSEKDHIAIIDVEPGNELSVYKSTLQKWLPPYENEIMLEKKKKEILQNISDALKFLKIDFIIE